MIDPALEQRIGEQLDRGDLEAAATVAVRGYGPQLLGYLRAALGPERADDGFSIFCESLWKALPGFRRESALVTWAYQLAWGAVQRVLADPARRRAVALTSGAMAAIAQEVRSTTAIHLRDETADRLARIRGRLDAAEQTLLILRVDRDLGWDDIATIMATDAPTLRKRLERLKQKIKRLADDDEA